MSAIAGMYRTDGQPVDPQEIGRMVSALAHRGPDGSGAWSSGAVGLGHCALWTTPEARRERLPLATNTGAVVITADARLDNRRELTAALGAAGDGELILRAWERWGEDSVARLIGDFAFAIWDGRTQTLFCGRDHIGVKPFYYYQGADVFLFATEIKALLTSPMVPYRLNPQRVADHLVGFYEDRASTFYRGIHRLPAGHTLTVRRAGTLLRRYWSLDATRELRLASDEAYTEAFAEAFTEAVRCRLRSSHPVGSLLSGGLDSSSIVGTARRITESGGAKNLDTFTAIFPGLPEPELRMIDERAFVDALVGQGGLDAHYVRGDSLSPLGAVDRALWHFDEAFGAPNLYLHWALYEAARDCGVRVLLDGIDGDTTVSHGLERLAGLARTGRFVALGRELRALSRRHGVGTRTLFRQFVVQPLVPASVRRGIRRLRGRPTASLAGTVINRQFARRMGVLERVEAFQREQERPVRSARESHARSMQSGLLPCVLELADKAAAAFGVEPRYPFFDRRLMELCLALPADQKLRGGWSRLVMRRAMDGILPDSVRWRPGKANLAPSFRRRLLDQDRSLVREVVVEHPEVLEEYVDLAALRRAYDRYVTQPPSEADALTVYSAVVLALWLQRAKLAA